MLKRLAILLLVCAVAAGAGYAIWLRTSNTSSQTAQVPALSAQPPPQVGVMEVRTAEVPLTFTYTGRVSGFREVEVRPQVGGIMLKREFEEGSRVKEGQVLFRIDPSTYQAALDRARAQLAQAQATQRQAEENFQRTEELVRRQVATQRQLDDARAARDQAVAGVQLAEAEVRTAQLNLDHTIITAPVSGVTSLQSPPEGTLIQAPQTLLTQINQLDPAYVIFSITDAEYLAFRNLNQRRARPVTERDITVELQYGNGSIYPQKGRIDVSASSVDPLTGTLQVRAIFPNADGAILPGEFVRVIVTGITLPDAIVIPKQAVNQGPQGPFVYAVGENNTAQVLPIRLGRELQSGWVVQSGLSPGQRIVVDGVIRVRPGAPVQPVPVTVDPATLAGTPSDAGGEATGSLGVPR